MVNKVKQVGLSLGFTDSMLFTTIERSFENTFGIA